MRGPHNLWRLLRTLATFERTGAIKTVLEQMEVPPRLRVLARVLGWPISVFGLKGDPALPPVTRAITALGPAYVKFGQILSTRPDVVGIDLANQLTYLQDRLPPFPTAEARAMISYSSGRFGLRPIGSKPLSSAGSDKGSSRRVSSVIAARSPEEECSKVHPIAPPAARDAAIRRADRPDRRCRERRFHGAARDIR